MEEAAEAVSIAETLSSDSVEAGFSLAPLFLASSSKVIAKPAGFIFNSRPGNVAATCASENGEEIPDRQTESFTRKEPTMSKEAAHHHSEAADHHEHAANHHREAAKHHEAGDHEKAAHHAQVAQGHHTYAAHHAEEAAKHHSDAHGAK